MRHVNANKMATHVDHENNYKLLSNLNQTVTKYVK
jgi:hypothetical protein